MRENPGHEMSQSVVRGIEERRNQREAVMVAYNPLIAQMTWELAPYAVQNAKAYERPAEVHIFVQEMPLSSVLVRDSNSRVTESDELAGRQSKQRAANWGDRAVQDLLPGSSLLQRRCQQQ